MSRIPWLVGGALFLMACLIGGLLIGAYAAPAPVVGVVRFDEVIDFETSARFNRIVEAARDDPAVAAVVVEISSPGGYATSSESLFYSLLNLRAVKPVVATIDGLAASGGYYMAAAANQIVASPSSYVGNVGTRGGRPADPVIFPEELSSGPYKLTGGSRFDQIRQLDLVATAFITNVVHQRANAALNPLTLSAAELAEARIYVGSEALALGLIDREGSRQDALDAAAALAGLSAYRVEDLAGYFGQEETVALPAIPLEERARALVSLAPPDTVFMLDDRIPLPGLAASGPLADHLRRLRAAAPGALLPAGGAPSSSLPWTDRR